MECTCRRRMGPKMDKLENTYAQSARQPLTPGLDRRRLEAPFYYAANAHILLSGNEATLLFTRPHPAILQDGNLAPVPLREPVALIQMSLAGLKSLSRAASDMIRQIEERTGEIQTEFTRSRDVVPELILPRGEKS
jgi:hypothetical protein